MDNIEQHSTTNNDKLKGTITTSDETYITAQDISSSDSSHQTNPDNLQNNKPGISSVTDKSGQKVLLKEKKDMEKNEQKKNEEQKVVTHVLPLRLIRRPSEECFHQVVKFIKRPAKREETELSEPKSSGLVKQDDISVVPVSEDSVNMKQNLDASLQLQSECCNSKDQTYLRLANDSDKSYSVDGSINELKSPDHESFGAEVSRGSHGNVIETGNLLQQVQEQQDQQKCGKLVICRKMGSTKMDEELKAPLTMTNNKPAKAQVILKKKRCYECFADAAFNAADSIIQKQPKSVDQNRSFVINDPQHCSVSATFSLGRPKKFFINKGTLTERNTAVAATATLQTSTTNASHLQNFINSAENSTSNHTKSLVTNFGTKTISSTGIHHFRNSVNFDTVSKCSDAASEIAYSASCRDSPQSVANSRGSGDYRTDCSSLNSLHSTDYKDGINRRKNNNNEFRESFSSRLSRGFLEFTQGSTDRLQKWKNKLQSGRRHKDSSEPPPVDRKMLIANREQSEHLSDVEVILDWATFKYDSNDELRGLNPSLQTSQPNLSVPSRSASDFNLANKNTASTKTLNDLETIMDHRTLIQRDDKSFRTVKSLAAHFQSLKNLQTTTEPIEYYDNVNNNLPPPVRILPYSGVKPKGMDIIKPIAFRPYASRKSDKRQTSISSSSFSFYGNNKKKNDFLTKRLSNNDELKQISQHSKHTVSSPSIPSSMNGPSRPKTIYQPSTSFHLTSAMVEKKKSSKYEAKENDYDVVPEYIERDKFYANVDSTINSNYSVGNSKPSCNNLWSEKIAFASATPNNNANINRDKIHKQKQQNGNAAINVIAGISSLNLVKKCPSSQQVCGSNTSSVSRYSSGVHVTPSPSDSGIVDYETIIRDKENELTNVRATMEQNEEAVVKVYLEKERLWKEQLADLKQKLQASQQGENALRQQIQRCNEEREHFQGTIQNLNNDKQGLQRKCLQLEHEFFQLRECFSELIRNRNETVCWRCRKSIKSDITATNTNNSNISDKRVKPPLPLPRYSKESSSERELRLEVDELKDEVSTLRDTINEQINHFADERKRWEEERIKILKFSPSNRFDIISTNGSSSVEINSQPSKDPKILTDGRSYIVSNDRLI